ncbi:DNA methyltransferase [Candidatus Methylomirabilis sp.]|uniref:Eco57I restriction-modification methylase domain-containing protein n=1 Tax=Candidatus Methylomirabilis sp. TaxID=2032687 RepID=UPI002A5CE206|nr:Eco57I restriction-modification methylase domain-containing protein [Candidatus Methylomirabilis sp.]
MPLDVTRTRQYLSRFDFKTLFLEELGWDSHTASVDAVSDGQTFALTAIAQKRGMVAFICSPNGPSGIPEYPTRRKIERQVAKSVQEHLIIYTDPAQTTQIWQWVKREVGKPTACREHTYHRAQPGDALIQKLQVIAFSLDEEERLSLVDVTSRTRTAFDVERVTKRFYDVFQKEHAAFLKFLKGIPDEELQRWYVSVMLNRLMFVYFIQKKHFLDGNPDYLRSKLAESLARGKDRFYREFLCPLFFEGFAKKDSERSTATNRLLGKVPYLNGGLFLRHQIEEQHGKDIQIADAAFEKLFSFFEQYHWHLDERPLRRDDEINPDVLGYIFEKYINQKQMGAYYTKEDITGYISQNTVVPFLFDTARQKCKIAFEGESSIWRLLQADPDRYFYGAVKKGAELPLPPDIAAGLSDVLKRTGWNRPASAGYALPTEIWREVVARRTRYEDVKGKLANGEIRDINDLITYNLDIRQFAQDVIENCEGPELLRAFYHAIEKVTVLDPTCGSGAFLFAALNILEPLYEACLDRMEVFLDELERSGVKHRPEKFSDFRKLLDRVASHPNPRYFILKSIIVNNLYGVDIMEEAVEICKLRLFLKLVAQIERVEHIEPLPDIDFNIRAGNTLVGYANLEEIKKSMEGDWVKLQSLPAIEENAEIADRAFQQFHEMQTEHGMEAKDFADAKLELWRRLKVLEDELNRYLAQEYGVPPPSEGEGRGEGKRKSPAYEKWLASHKPFHWFIEFYRIMKSGGFDVVIGNPPYVEYRLVKDIYKLSSDQYKSENAGNLYAFCMERSCVLLGKTGWFGMIVPAAVLGLDETLCLRDVLLRKFPMNFCSTYAIRPSKLFDGVDQRLCIYLGMDGKECAPIVWTTKYRHWNSEERPALFARLEYVRTLTHHRLKRIPQVGSHEAVSILAKLEARSEKVVLSYYSNGPSGYDMHYHRSPRYWIRAMDFEQYFKSPTRTRSIHHFRDLHFKDKREARVVGAALNSSLFFYWFVSVGNGRNITGTDVEQFPLGNLSEDIVNELPRLFDKLMKDYKVHSFIRVRQDCEFQEFRPSMSKPIIDEIDRALAKHYGFTDEELDFIINYDIKYRMGGSDNDGDE